MSEIDKEDLTERLLDKIEEMLTDVLSSYQEVILNCQEEVYEEDSLGWKGANGSVLYNEIDSTIPIFTTVERYVEEFREEMQNFIELYFLYDGDMDSYRSDHEED